MRENVSRIDRFSELSYHLAEDVFGWRPVMLGLPFRGKIEPKSTIVEGVKML